MSVRSTTSQKGLVAILVEDGGPAVVAVPVNPREGLLLSAGESATIPTWTTLVEQVCQTLGGEIDAVELDVDADAALCARVLLTQGETAYQVPCALQRRWLLRSASSFPSLQAPSSCSCGGWHWILRSSACDSHGGEKNWPRWRPMRRHPPPEHAMRRGE